MRKFLLIAMVMLSVSTFAQNYTMRVSSFMAEDSWEAYDYIYGSIDGIDLQCVNKHDFITPMEYIDSLTYDENGRIQRLATWQQMEDGAWVFACCCDYTYNELGLRATRKNYNSLDGGETLELGGIYYYNYDENGNMTDWSLDFAGVEYQKGTIEYNDNGQKEAEIIMQYNFGTYYLENSFLTEYEYDANGNMTRSIEYFYETETWVPQIIRVNEYDEAGNCIVAETRTAAGTVQEKYVYTYDMNYLSKNIFHYVNPEEDFPVLPQMNNLLKSFEFYAMNDMYELVYVTDYLLGYEVIAEEPTDTTFVKEIAINSNIYPNPAQDFVMIESSDVDYVEVLDVFGRVMFATEMKESVKVDMSEYATGVYFVRLHANGATSTQKIMKD